MQFELGDVAEGRVLDMEAFKGEFNRAKRDIFRFVTDVNRFSQLVSKLGTARDTIELRKRINNFQGDLTERAHKIGTSLTDLKNYTRSAGPSERHEVNKLIGETQDQLKRFKSVQEECKRSMERSLPTSDPDYDKSGTPMVPLQSQQQLQLEQQQQQQQQLLQQESDPLLDSQITHYDALIQERDQGIREINIQIGEVNDIFQDLAVLVADQDGMVGDIDNNMQNVQSSVDRGRGELGRAEQHQKGATKRMWCLFCIAVVVLVIIIVTILEAL